MIVFLLRLTICWAFFALVYVLLLRRETFFQANRFYLIGTAILSIVLAFFAREWGEISAEIPVIVLPEIVISYQKVEAATHTLGWSDYWFMLYGLGVALGLTRLAFSLVKIAMINGRSEVMEDGVRVVVSTAIESPFSFLSHIYLPENSNIINKNDLPCVLAHEAYHVRNRHSLDVLFAEMLCIVFWFHPLAFWYRKALRAVHEYAADAAVSRIHSVKQYGLLLIKQAQSGVTPVIAHHFYQSPLKQRIIMLTKSNSAPIKALSYGLVLPLMMAFGILFRQAPVLAQTIDQKHLEYVRQLEANGWVSYDTIKQDAKEEPKIVKNDRSPIKNNRNEIVYKTCEILPQYKGGQAELMSFLATTIEYPKSAQDAGTQGTVMVRFVVLTDGTITDVQVVSSEDAPYQSLNEEAKRVIWLMQSKWIPGQHQGKAVNCIMHLPIKFKLASEKKDAPYELPHVDVMPEYTGGQEAMMKFLAENIKYPPEAVKEKAEGVVVLTFVIEKDGSVIDVVPIGGSAKRQDMIDEAIRVVKLMPKWKPAVKDREVVKVKFTLPIKFKLN